MPAPAIRHAGTPLSLPGQAPAKLAEHMSHGRSQSESSISGLLHRLNSADAGSAWAEFIDRYSGLMMKTVTQFDYEQHRGNECFLFVCEKPCDQQFRRLQKFNTAGSASFRNWLSTVVFNLCVDWHRREFGRASILPAISALPALDRLVYRHCYELDMDQQSCYQAIRSDFPGLGREQVTASLARIHSLLTPHQRWKLSMRKRAQGNSLSGQTGIGAEQIPDPGPGPETLAQNEEKAAWLQTALSRLSTDQRLLLQLRFQEGLTFGKIAKLENLGDAHRARRHVQAALDALYIQLQKPGSGQTRQF